MTSKQRTQCADSCKQGWTRHMWLEVRQWRQRQLLERCLPQRRSTIAEKLWAACVELCTHAKDSKASPC